MSDELREKLSGELATVGWRDLRQHAGRGAFFLVSGELALLDAAMGVAADDKASVEVWLQSGQLARPEPEVLEAWEEALDRPFEYVIVQPFVLARELPDPAAN